MENFKSLAKCNSFASFESSLSRQGVCTTDSWPICWVTEYTFIGHQLPALPWPHVGNAWVKGLGLFLKELTLGPEALRLGAVEAD